MGDNVKTLAKDEKNAILQIRDKTGDGTMTLYMPFEGVYLCFCDIHMGSCESGFVLEEGVKVFCFDHCREGRIECEIRDGVYSILQERQARMDNRKHHSGHVVFPLNHFHGISLCIDVEMAQKDIKDKFPAFSVDISAIRSKFCKFDKPYILKNDEGFERIMAGLYFPPPGIKPEYYEIKVLEILFYLDAIDVRYEKETKGLLYRGLLNKVKMVYQQITENPQIHYTIEELALEYDISQTALKATFKEVYGDSIYSFLKRYRINIAASMLIKNNEMSISQIAHSVGYESVGKFSSAFKKVMGVPPLAYRKNGADSENNIIGL